jgi:hypothetical protein
VAPIALSTASRRPSPRASRRAPRAWSGSCSATSSSWPHSARRHCGRSHSRRLRDGDVRPTEDKSLVLEDTVAGASARVSGQPPIRRPGAHRSCRREGGVALPRDTGRSVFPSPAKIRFPPVGMWSLLVRTRYPRAYARPFACALLRSTCTLDISTYPCGIRLAMWDPETLDR